MTTECIQYLITEKNSVSIDAYLFYAYQGVSSSKGPSFHAWNFEKESLVRKCSYEKTCKD